MFLWQWFCECLEFIYLEVCFKQMERDELRFLWEESLGFSCAIRVVQRVLITLLRELFMLLSLKVLLISLNLFLSVYDDVMSMKWNEMKFSFHLEMCLVFWYFQVGFFGQVENAIIMFLLFLFCLIFSTCYYVHLWNLVS